MSTINLWTVSNPDEFIFPHEVIVFSQTMGAKHPLPKEAEPVEKFSQLSATNEDCLIIYWREILNIRFSNTW
jgi:hypothetical protein